jgi:hypothetical protein
MKVSREDELWLCNGGPKQLKFKYCIERSMTKEISDWLFKTFKGYGQDYYYSHGEIWFMKGKQETLFLLKWS